MPTGLDIVYVFFEATMESERVAVGPVCPQKPKILLFSLVHKKPCLLLLFVCQKEHRVGFALAIGLLLGYYFIHVSQLRQSFII